LLVKRMQTLGSLAVFDGPRPLGGNAQQPRRLAILAVLARSGDRGVNRDRLAALLWGDVEEERARRNLNQALYALRQELGAEDAILGTRDLRLNPELIEVDLQAFETARASARSRKRPGSTAGRSWATSIYRASRPSRTGPRRSAPASRPTTGPCSRPPRRRGRTGAPRCTGGAGWRRSTRRTRARPRG
jgi:hypothetical protein